MHLSLHPFRTILNFLMHIFHDKTVQTLVLIMTIEFSLFNFVHFDAKTGESIKSLQDEQDEAQLKAALLNYYFYIFIL